jgi:diguanylate cyclase (GGDEF)-like protein
MFYYTIASVSALILLRRRTTRLALLAASAGALFMACHLLFPPGSVPVRIPEPALRVMYAYSALSAMAATCLFSYLFRLEIDRAEEALTESNRALERLAVLDPLTGVANRRALEQRLEQEWERARRHGTEVALLVCDVDHFKAYNDRYGHVAGDTCLQQVAAAIEGVIRRATDLVARYGGEEFIVILPETPLTGAVRVAEDVRRRVAALAIPHDAGGGAGVVTLSIGVACGRPESLTSPDELLKRADVALYEAKRRGRNTVQAADLAEAAVVNG